MNSDVAVLIVSYNVRAALCRAIQSIPQDAHIVVADNASADDTVAHLRQHHPRVTVQALPRNHGFSYALNSAAQLTQAPYVLVLNPDAWLRPGALPLLKQSLLQHGRSHNAWVVGPKQLDDDGRLQLSCGPVPTLLGEACRRTVQRTLDQPERTSAWLVRQALALALRAPTPVGWVAGSAMFMTRQHFMRVGGFDPRFFLYFEDIDFCQRVRRAGGSILYDPTIVVGHSRGVSAQKAPTLAQSAYRDSQRYYAARHQGRLFNWVTRAWVRRQERALSARGQFARALAGQRCGPENLHP